jgi:hypothetical protein
LYQYLYLCLVLVLYHEKTRTPVIMSLKEKHITNVITFLNSGWREGNRNQRCFGGHLLIGGEARGWPYVRTVEGHKLIPCVIPTKVWWAVLGFGFRLSSCPPPIVCVTGS